MRDLDIFRAIHDWLSNAETVWLCTVLGTWGSSPRPVGSLLACNSKGEYIGSLSGGCVEDNLLSRIVAGEFSEAVAQIQYGSTTEESEKFRLPCGGILEVAIEKLQPSEVMLSDLAGIISALDKRQSIVWQCDCSDVRHVLGPQFRLLLIGVSEVSRAVAQIALLMDYEVLVCDPRADARSRWDIAGATVLALLPDDAVRKFGDDQHCAILALTHDPRIDDMGLMEAFNTQAFYIGAMGSLRTSQQRRTRLALLDVSEEQMHRLHAPIGLDTGSKTPMEIAVSVLAQLTAVRAGKLE
jgi:xanthine dehydrogenase accessory factor